MGDVTKGPALAHKAAREGKVAAEVLAGASSEFDNIAVPAVLFTYLAIEMGACLEDLIVSIHPHPIFSESIMEAAEMAAGGSVHVFRKRT